MTAKDLLVITPDGTAWFDARHSGEPILAAVRRHICGTLSIQGMADLRVFSCDDFSDQPANPLADHVLTAVIGYEHPTGWRGTVVVTMEDDRVIGDIPPLTSDAVACLDLALTAAGVTPAASVKVSPDFDACPAGQVDLSEVGCVLCLRAPCACPQPGTPEYLRLID